VSTGGLESTWKIPTLQPVFYGIWGGNPKQRGGFRAGKYIRLGVREQARSQIVAIAFTGGVG
jgi:hypothetical protein